MPRRVCYQNSEGCTLVDLAVLHAPAITYSQIPRLEWTSKHDQSVWHKDGIHLLVRESNLKWHFQIYIHGFSTDAVPFPEASPCVAGIPPFAQKVPAVILSLECDRKKMQSNTREYKILVPRLMERWVFSIGDVPHYSRAKYWGLQICLTERILCLILCNTISISLYVQWGRLGQTAPRVPPFLLESGIRRRCLKLPNKN